MNLAKYAVYIGAVIIIALLFEQIMTFFYNLTVSGINGAIESYIYLAIIWVVIYLLARLMFNKKVHPKSSQFALVGGMLHIGATLAIYFYNSNPWFLLIFPILIGIGYRLRQVHPNFTKNKYKLTPVYPEFIDDRGGLCVLRTGAAGFVALKFFQLRPPLPFKEILLYLFHEQLEHTLEIQNSILGPYCLGIITRGRRYDSVQQHCVASAHRLREFFKKQQVAFYEVNDCLNILRVFYAPYFRFTPAPLDMQGRPLEFLQLSNTDNELIITQDLEEATFTLHAFHPHFKQSTLYSFLATITDPYFLQFHNRPLSSLEVAALETKHNEEYRSTLKRLTTGLEDNAEFQAAAYLFSSAGQVSKENLEPLLDQEELAHLEAIKKRIQETKDGAVLGLWETELRLMSDPILAQTLAINLGGTNQPLPPSAITPLILRAPLGVQHTIDSKQLFALLPKVAPKENHNPPPQTISPIEV